jgi:hypothetical protein
VFEKRLHVDDQVFDHLQPKQGFDGDLLSPQVLHQHFASQPVDAIDAHGIGTAYSVSTRAAEGERAVDIALDIFQQIQHPVGGLCVQLILFVMRLLVFL